MSDTIKKRILIADDERDFTRSLRAKLERLGYDVEEVQQGSDVFRRVMTGQIDLVLLDYRMADESGDKVCLSIRSEARFKNLPILFVTGFRHMEEQAFQELGATAVIYKPIDFEELAQKVAQYLGEAPLGSL